MESATKSAYISKRMIEAFSQERSKKQVQKQMALAPIKEFKEDEEEKEESLPLNNLQSMVQKEKSSILMDEDEVLMASNAVNQPVKAKMAVMQAPQAAPQKQGMIAGAFSKLSNAMSMKKKPSPEELLKKEMLKNNSSSDEEMSEQMYMQRNISAECCDEDDLEGAMCYSDEEDNSRSKVKQVNKQRRKQMGRKTQKFQLEVDTNIYEVQFACLKNDATLVTGDPEICPSCQAIFNSKSKLEIVDNQQIWNCEFCNTKNEVMLDEGEIPKVDTVNYMVQAAAQVEEQKMGGQEISVIFCLDTSGSMCVTQEVKGKFQLKNDKRKKMAQDLAQFGDNSDQFITNAQKNMTYVSRLQCVQSAVNAQLDQMSKGAPNRKVGIVTFSGEVVVLGDGHADAQHIAGDKLDNFDFLEKNGAEQAGKLMNMPIKDSAKILSEKLMDIEETGPTALGPAVLTAVTMAAQGAAGSTVVICTDGLANVGLGAFDEAKTEEQIVKCQEFWERVAQIAQSKGITINLVSIEGDECNIDSLSKICELSGGSIDRVNPVTLTQNFTSILSKPVIATQVCTKVKLHKGLRFRNEQEINISQNQTLLVKESANVTEDDVFTFEYTIKTLEELLAMEDFDLSTVKELPFQAQISYTAINGNKLVRVITQTLAVSDQREELEKVADQEILQRNVIQQSSKIARGGNYMQAQAVAKTWQRHMKNNIQSEAQVANYQDFSKNFGEVYNQIGQINQEQQQMDSMQDMQCEMADECMAMPQQNSMRLGAMASAPKNKKSVKAGDALSSMLYKGSRASKK